MDVVHNFKMPYLATVTLLSLCLPSLTSILPEVVFFPVENDYFTVAVYEHARVGNFTADPPKEVIRMNLDYYRRATALAKSKDADIILFPEYGLFPLEDRPKMKGYLESIPDPETGTWNPCMQTTIFSDRPMLRNLSCMAMENQIVVVVNTGDIQPCNQEQYGNCSEDGTFHYNANTVFDRYGTIISRYRKEHLFLEIGMDLPQGPQYPIFITDFGIFAHFICFDSVFKHMVNTGHIDGVDGVFLSAMWVDGMPIYHSIQYFQSWAIGNNVTLVLSNLQIPVAGAVGSGVFGGSSGAVSYTFNPDGKSKLLVTKAPKTNRAKLYNTDSSITIITSNGSEPYNEDDVDFDTYIPEFCTRTSLDIPENETGYRCAFQNTNNYTFVKLTAPHGQVDACSNGMCCSLKYSLLSVNESFYLGVINSTYNTFTYSWCEEICVVFRCEAFDENGCSLFATRSSTVFLELELKANFTTHYVYPSVMRTGMRAASLSEWDYVVEERGDNYEGSISFTNSSPKNKMVVASLNGRCYDRDPPYTR